MTEARPATVASPAGVAGGERRASRNRGLDGIRGVAAAMVVAHHLALCGGWMSDPFAEQPAISSGFERAMTYSPLHLLWAGGEAVFVFFVLSGYVLARTDVSTPRRTAGFVGKRFVRLYVPAAAAIALATVQFVLIRRRAGEEDGWLRWHGTALGWSDPLQLATLVTDTGQQVDSVLWSLRWEVLFSAVVPIALACLALAIGRRAPYVATALCACIALSIYQSTGVLFYLPMFLLGTLAALNEAAIGRRVDRLRRHVPDGALAAIALVLAALMLSVRWWANPVRLTDVHAVQQALAGLEQLVVVLGACVAVLAVVHVASARRFLEAGVLLRLGSRSFSLYLVHEPVIVSVAQRFDPQHRPLDFLVVSLVVIAVVTEVFYRLVERPSIALARHVHARIVAGESAPSPATAGRAAFRRRGRRAPPPRRRAAGGGGWRRWPRHRPARRAGG